MTRSPAVPAPPAAAAGLTYVSDLDPGIRRVKTGAGFGYRDADGKRIEAAATLERIRALAIPPAWTDVWICPDPSGHIQATGRDAQGRKQYRYHDRWSAVRSASKFRGLADFGGALPALRAQVEADMRRRDLCFERVVATTVWLLDNTLIRIGNREYGDSSHGLTTLLDEHARCAVETLRLRFVGKSGREHDVTVQDRRVATVVRRCQELPGQRLLQYLDGEVVRSVESRDVNDYIRQTTDTDFTAKTFRTWGASAHAIKLFEELGAPAGEQQALSDIRDVVRETASLLHNTAAVCRASYIHPAVLEAHRTGALPSTRPVRRHADVLERHERRLLALLGPSRR